jgi:hypothetical protein
VLFAAGNLCPVLVAKWAFSERQSLVQKDRFDALEKRYI